MHTHGNHGMTPHLHTSGSDYLFFESWRPASAGEILGSCIVLLIVSLLDRLISGLRGRLEVYWVSREQYEAVPNVAPEDQDFFRIELGPVGAANFPMVEPPSRKRTIVTPFVPAHDLSRGILHAVHTLLSYTLMLAAMTFNVFYLVSIVVGFGLGEMLFGRWNARADWC